MGWFYFKVPEPVEFANPALDMAASPRYVVGNGINANSRALFANSGYPCNILHQNPFSEEKLNLVFAA